mmetsp:Transcript_3632/g.14645  ORF Transcript_3632/g.14645 Transcript_3632/m.14645 type:complete len:264 (+) Transcript_3632:138-929(+)
MGVSPRPFPAIRFGRRSRQPPESAENPPTPHPDASPSTNATSPPPSSEKSSEKYRRASYARRTFADGSKTGSRSGKGFCSGSIAFFFAAAFGDNDANAPSRLFCLDTPSRMKSHPPKWTSEVFVPFVKSSSALFVSASKRKPRAILAARASLSRSPSWTAASPWSARRELAFSFSFSLLFRSRLADSLAREPGRDPRAGVLTRDPKAICHPSGASASESPSPELVASAAKPQRSCTSNDPRRERCGDPGSKGANPSNAAGQPL